MHTPRPKYFCPQCRASYTVDQNYCGRCGADMKHVSGLLYAEKLRKRPSSSEPAMEVDGSSDTVAQADSDGLETSPRQARDHRTRGRDPWLGQVVDNRYKVIEVLGRGGMGVVYKVEHQRMGKIAAMKVLHGDLADEPDVAGRFRREAATVSRLNHPNTVQVFDFGTARGALYLIMEYVRGLDLGSLLTRDGPLPFDRAAPLFAQICSALDEAHDLGVTHRDLKPENILVTRTHSGRDFVKVLDFGLAKLSEREDANEVTDRGSIVGTPYYMSPEQIRGEEEVDARSDLYSLGALMYKVLTGEPAYTAKSPVGVLTKHLTAELVAPSERVPELEIHERVDRIVCRAMEKKPADRYQSALELLTDLEDTFADLVGGTGSRGLPGLSLSSFAGSSSARSRAPAAESLVDHEVDYGIDSSAMLRRSDIDSYEAAIRRRRFVGVAVVPLLLLAAAAGAVYWFVLRPEPPRTAEAEPNDRLGDATPIAAGTEVTGFLGQRVSEGAGDADFFRLVDSPAPEAAVTASVTGLPNIDVTLALYDATGQLIHERNENPAGEGESIRGWRVRKDVVLAVGQVEPPRGALPVENVSDPYTLVVELADPAPGVELEPNEGLADAQAIAPGATLTGYLDRRHDTDSFRYDGAAGRRTIRIGGAGSVPLVWRVGAGGEPRTERSAQVEISPGDLIQLQRADRDLPDDRALPGAAEPYALELR